MQLVRLISTAGPVGSEVTRLLSIDRLDGELLEVLGRTGSVQPTSILRIRRNTVQSRSPLLFKTDGCCRTGSEIETLLGPFFFAGNAGRTIIAETRRIYLDRSHPPSPRQYVSSTSGFGARKSPAICARSQ